MTVAASEIRNISAWRLNKAEMNELAERVKKGEEEAVVKKELQTKKAVACEERKKSAAAISAKPGSTGPKASKKTSSSAATQSATAAATPDPTNAGYYALVEADLQTILQEFPGIDQEMPLPLSKSELDGSKTGVQEPFDLESARHALGIHRVFRCSISLFWVRSWRRPRREFRWAGGEFSTWESFTSRTENQLSWQAVWWSFWPTSRLWAPNPRTFRCCRQKRLCIRWWLPALTLFGALSEFKDLV